MAIPLRRLAWALSALVATTCFATTVSAASLYLNVAGITGEDATPGYPGAMAVSTAAVNLGAFSIVKNVDLASSTIAADVVSGKHLAGASLLLYNAAPAGPPDAVLPFGTAIAASRTVLGGTPPQEQDAFAATTPGSMFLEIPGITGELSTPGFSGLLQIQSLSLTGNDFSITKPVDTASPEIAKDVVAGAHFSTATILFYDATTPTGPPDTTLVFNAVLASSQQFLGGGDIPSETDTFNFISVSQPTPEPAALALLITGALLLGARRMTTRTG